MAIVGFMTIVCFGSAKAQMHFVPDTVELGCVTIETCRQKTFSAGSKEIEADTLLMQLNHGRPLADVLLQLIPLNFKTYGTSGSASSISLRGAGGSRTQIAWNGMPLNSLTSGDVNLSVLSASTFDNVHINYSAPASLYGSNSFGGVINLVNTSPFEPLLNVQISQQLGTLNTHHTSASVQLANKLFSSKTSLWHFGSDNNFTYYDEYLGRDQKRYNAQHTNFGLMHNSSFRINSNHVLSAGLWLQENETGVPPVNGTNPKMQFSNQKNKTARGFLKWNWYKNKLLISGRSFLFYDYMLYTQKLNQNDENYSINSDIISLQSETEFSGRYTFSNFVTADAGASLRRNTADGVNFTSKPTEDQAAIFSAFRYENALISGVFSVRKEFSTLFVPPVRFGVGLNLRPLKNLKLRASANQKYRMPTFNDKYWPALGNINIKPETGITYDGGFAYSINLNRFNVGTDVSAYWLNMKDMIAWLPQGGTWKPINYPSVLSKGIESKLWVDYKGKGFYVRNDMAFDVNNTREKGATYQLRYTPKYTASNVLSFSVGKLSGTVSGNYLSRRHIDDTYFTLNEIYSLNSSIQYLIPLNKINVFISGSVKNITNNTEPITKDYPNAGRQITGGLKLQYRTIKQ